MKTLAIIPARGGSKRIEHKNIKDFAGLPIIVISIQAALKSGCFDEVMVSTDDEQIAEVAREYGASVPFMRTAETSDDFATTADVIREVINAYRNRGEEYDAIACIYATAPFITAERLKEGYDIVNKGEAQGAFTCVEYSYPIQRSLVIGKNGRIGMKFPEYSNSRSQDLEKTYHDAGQFYFTTVKAFEESGSLWGPDTLPIILPEMEVQDLDTPQDWELAELKFSLLKKDLQTDCGNHASTANRLLPEMIELKGFRLVSYTRLSDKESELMREGRNNPDVRNGSINSEYISEESHSDFVKSLENRDDCRYYAVYNSYDEAIGSINLKVTSPGRADRGIWLFTEHQGMGYATKVLEELYGWLKDNSDINIIETTVKLDNDASQALEERVGSAKTCEDDEYAHYELKLR